MCVILSILYVRYMFCIITVHLYVRYFVNYSIYTFIYMCVIIQP
nr:MAG TPA: hypothetical protein [Caudoviricetes sp.]